MHENEMAKKVDYFCLQRYTTYSSYFDLHFLPDAVEPLGRLSMILIAVGIPASILQLIKTDALSKLR